MPLRIRAQWKRSRGRRNYTELDAWRARRRLGQAPDVGFGHLTDEDASRLRPL